MTYMLSIKRVLGDDDHPRGPYVYNERLSTKEPRPAWYECKHLPPPQHATKPNAAKPEPEPEPVNVRQKPGRRQSHTGYMGVKRVVKGEGVRYEASVYHDGKARYAGTYHTAEEAGRARDAKVRELGLKRKLNFPKG
jgi:hypothetical protein